MTHSLLNKTLSQFEILVCALLIEAELIHQLAYYLLALFSELDLHFYLVFRFTLSFLFLLFLHLSLNVVGDCCLLVQE